MALLTFSDEDFIPRIFASLGGTASMAKGITGEKRREILTTAFFYKTEEYKFKHHTLRSRGKGKRQWKKGDTIDFWKGTPRNPAGNPFKFATTPCTGVQDVEFSLALLPELNDHRAQHPLRLGLRITVDGRSLHPLEIAELAHNDGFDSVNELLNWFLPKMRIGQPLELQLIHWTNKRYEP